MILTVVEFQFGDMTFMPCVKHPQYEEMKMKKIFLSLLNKSGHTSFCIFARQMSVSGRQAIHIQVSLQFIVLH